jgi:tryptophanyl-tRNA synthetase
METEKEKIILSGMRPTGVLHIGNYFGALLPLVQLQDKADKFFIMIADLHALTTLNDSKDLRKNSLSLTMTFLAAGINPKKSNIFIQSQIPEHAELSNILGMITPLSMLELNPVYKEMKQEFKQNNLGLLAYPVLQAADILLYKTTSVPVGKDQKPHIEITREIARKFNARFGNVFTEPKAVLQKESKILSLQNPSKKMSKSHGEKTYISLLDSPEKIRGKIKIAVTDSGKEIKYDEKKKPAISNLLTIYSLFSGKPIKETERQYHGKGYAEFKKDLAEMIIKGLTPLQKKYKQLEKNPDYVKEILNYGAESAKQTASITMEAVREKIGFFSN